MMHQRMELEQAIAEVEKLQKEKKQLIACAGELELEASHNYYVLTKELRDLKAAYKEVKEKYEFSESHYQMTLRHANNLQAMLDARNDELAQTHRHADNLQGMLNARNNELTQVRSYADNLQNELNYRDIELLQLRGDLENLQSVLALQNDELQQTRRHADNLQKMLDTWKDELMQARRHADNLQIALDLKAQGSSKLHRVKERVKGWFK